MRKALLLCSLVLFVLSGVAYIAKAQDDPGLNFPPYDAPPQARIQFYENEIHKCKDYLDELSLAINNATILFNVESAKNYTFAGYGYTKRLHWLDDEVSLVCNRIRLHQESIRNEMDKVPPAPSPTPTPSPGPRPSPPKTETKSDPSNDPLKNKQIGEHNAEIKFINDYRKKLKEVKTGANKVLKEIDDYVKTGKPQEPTPGFNAESISSGGLWITTFTVPQGRLIVNLPVDIRAGDKISGTLLTEPNGNTDSERTLNRDALNQYDVTIAIPRNAGDSKYMWQEIVTSANRQPGQPVAYFDAVMHSSPPLPGGAGAAVTYNTSQATFTIQRPGVYLLDAELQATFRYPTIGQDGRSAETKGPFDGNLRNTEIKIGGQPVSVLAESPRSCIFKSPEQNFGPADITVKDNNIETKGTYRNLGLRLSAPRTSLLKGETTVLTVTVEGLKGIQQNVPLLLQKEGVVSMAGGDTQTVQIRPADVRADGTFELKRTLTGLQAGAFGVTATVIDPARRPIIIPLTENAKVNGFRVRKDGDKFVVEVENAQSPITGKPVDGEHKLEHNCPSLSKVPYLNQMFLNKGSGRSTVNCLMLMVTPRIIIQDE